jgi:two-component sensor histidine kinase
MVFVPRSSRPAAFAPSLPVHARSAGDRWEDEVQAPKMSGDSPPPPTAMQSLSLRQLRYHTRNVLQCVLIEIHEHAADWRLQRGRCLLEQLADRIQRSVEISDALFGVTSEPGPFPERFHRLCHGTLSLFADPAQHLQLDISIEGTCPPELEMPVLRAAHKFVGNAVKHGMRVRLQGRVSASLTCTLDEVMLIVADDGWDLTHLDNTDEGPGLARDLADQFAGSISLERRGDNTVATIILQPMK